MTVAVIILNYQTADLTVACFRSLAVDARQFSADTGHVVRAIIVDNFSRDDSVQRIAAAISADGGMPWATLLPLPRNGGFAYGNNRGIELVPAADYVLLLNSDTIVNPGMLKACFEAMQAAPSIGVMSCLVRNADGSVQNVARKFPTPLRAVVASLGLPWLFPRWFAWADIQDVKWDRLTTKRDVDWLGGAFLFIRMSALRQAGALDEDFFFYGEDIEFCHRMWKCGFRCFYDPTASITHLGGGSTDALTPALSRSTGRGGKADALRRQARYLVQRKCYGRAAAIFVRAIDTLAGGLRSFRPRRRGERGIMEL